MTRAISSVLGRPGRRIRRCRKENHAVATGPKIAIANEELATRYNRYEDRGGMKRRGFSFLFHYFSWGTLPPP